MGRTNKPSYPSHEEISKAMLDRHFCTDCAYWGNEWVSDLSRECRCPDNHEAGGIYLSAMLCGCSHWKARTE